MKLSNKQKDRGFSIILILVITAVIFTTPYVADRNGRNNMKYMMICERRHVVEKKIIKCYKDKKKCTSLKRKYFKRYKEEFDYVEDF